MSIVSEQRSHQGVRATASMVAAPVAVPIWITLYLLVLLIPIEFSFYISGLLITPMRAFLLLVSLPAFAMFFSRRAFRLEDGFLVLFAFWVFFSVVIRSGVSAIDLGGQRFLEIAVSYILARTLIIDRSQIRSMMKLLLFIVAILGVLAIPEAISHYRFLHEIPRKLTGFYYYISNDTRMNMLRASSTFEHPILFGLFAASSLALLWYTAKTTMQRFWRVFFTGLAAFFSLSSAAILVYGLQMGLILLELTTRWLPRRLTVFTVSLVAVVTFLELASNRGSIRLIASYLTFSAHTAYYRINQWIFTIDDVFRHPLFGLKMSQWTRPAWMTDSIDNHWLFIGFAHGIPAVLALWGVILVIFIRVLQQARSTKIPEKRAIEMAWIIAAIALFMGAWTVTYFGKMLPYYAFFLGLGSAIARLPKETDTPTAQPVPDNDPPAQRRSRYTRFANGPATAR